MEKSREKAELDRVVDKVKPLFMVHGLVYGSWFMVHGFVLGSVYDSVHGLVNGFVHDSWFILTFKSGVLGAST